MRSEPQASAYRPDPRIETVSAWLAAPVAAAAFPRHVTRFRNGRWARAVGLDGLDEAQWIAHFARFEPLAGNLAQPLALKYHGHQFRAYNPDIGDGRGFLFAQLRDGAGRLLDLGTKGSGQTPFSRDGDGRLTLKGAVREILATEMLEALGVNTSKTFSVIETGEALWRGDEPSPTRSAVLVRLSHGHIRIGTFQRLLAHDERDHMAALVAYCLETYPGGEPPADAPGRDEPAVILMHQVVERMADLAASYMVAGFVHGVLNTDNMNISGESFDYGPWRWLPRWEPGFTAAYFDHTGLYAFGRQPEAILWNCGQFAVALRLLAESEPLIAALDRFGPLYAAAMARRFTARLGVAPRGQEHDTALILAAERSMRESGVAPESFFFAHRGGRAAPAGELADILAGYAPAAPLDDPIWAEPTPPGVLIDEVERTWSAIDAHDDWAPLHEKVAAIRRLGAALGESTVPRDEPLAR
ncbi:protein adenylyltransferase SelO family protein [Novosphingobium album (ex Liu et al. 2023)]|uniref:Protein nucleotidyltransferase YdiU n=1 Tax=Novosphingobium album (ex Liu et al. 2023) TaxID=3031130 RepID=A0ABT5WSC8_9SPHN|nr:YdiU family protein [Novosphingobium album (ex Liu et al. 2023)]MDE8652955.1 YdiU family protein [Novosphingobium album (ex Liu et al. 2023)]